MISKNTILKNLEKYLKRSFKGKVRINESSLIAYLLVGGFFCFVSNVGYATVAGKGKIEYKSTGSTIDDGLAINFAKALGNSQTIAIGGNDDDGGNGNAIAKGVGSIAIGGNSRTEASTGVAVGWHAEAKGENGTAYGESTVAAKDSVAIGSKAEAKEGATALGAKSKSLGTNSIALGLEAEAKQNESIAIGHAAKADELHAISMGDQANTKSQNGISIGAGAVADGQSSIVIGKGSKISELTDAAGRPKNRDAAVVIGVDSVSKNQYTITMGHRAETLGQDSFAFGHESKARKDRAIAFGERTIADGENSMALGSKAGAYTVNTLAFGAGAQAKESQAISIGNKAHSNGENSISIGTTSLVGKVGQYGTSTGEKIVKNGTAIGGYSNVDANGGTTIGSFTTVNNEGGVALGIDSIANVAGGKAGAKQTYSAYNSTKAGAFTSTDTYNGNMRTGVAPRNNLKAGAVSVGKADGSFTRQIVGLAAGTQDTDAVNVAQLKSLTMKIEGDKNEGETPKVGLWDGSLKVTAKGTGSIKASTVVEGNKVTVNVDSTDLEKKIQAAGKVKYFSVKSTGGNNENNDGATADNAVAIGKNSSATEENSIALGSDATTANAKKEVTQAEVQAGNGDKVVYNGFAGTKPYAQLSVGSKDKERQIKNVAAGEVSASSTDAVNGSQLYAVAAKPMTYTDDKETQINRLLGQNINLKGGAQGDLSTGNIAVEASGTDTLNIKLAKNLKEIDSISKNGKAGSPKITLGDSNISFNSDVDMGSKKITNVAAGDVSENSTDAVNGSQLDKVAKESKTEVKSEKKTVQVTKKAATDGHTIYNVEVRQNVKYVTEDGKEVILGTDGKFYSSDSLEEDGSPKTGVTEISKDKVKAKLVDEVKLDKVADGKISKDSKEAINGSQLKEVGDYLGLQPKKDGTGFEKPTFTALKNVDGNNADVPTTIVDAIKKTIGKVNEGLKYGADAAKDNHPGTQQLGSTLFIKSATEDLTKAGNTGTKFVGKNIVTNYENNGGNGTVSIGISEKPEFKEVTLKDGDGNITTINKDGMTIAAKDPAGVKKEVSLTKDGLNNGGNKITNVADGNIAPDSKDAVNGSQLDKVAKESKTEVKSEKKTVQVTESKGNDGQTVYNLEVKQNVVYKDGAGKDVVQGEDGNFYHPEDLNDAGKPKDGTVKPVDSVKAELAKEAKLDKVADGKISKDSKEAINGSQLKEVGDYLGLKPKQDGTGFEKPTFTALKKVDGSDNTAPENIIDSVNTTIGKVNEGFKYGADMAKDNQTNPGTQQLGSTLFIKSATEDLTKAGNTGTKFVGKNIVTNYENNGGNGTVSIGISEKPEFKEVVVKDETGDVVTTITKEGVKIEPKTPGEGKEAVSLTKDGLNNGGNKITHVAAGEVSENSTDAVNGGQLHAVKQDVKAAKTEVKAGESGNVTVNKSEDTTDKHPVYTVDMKKDITLDKVTVKDKEDNKTEVTPGKVSVDGKNGSGVTLNGADGSIGLKGENGKDALSIKGEKGQAGVDGKNGTDGKTRIVYEYADPKNPKTTVREEVATLNDGIKYKGDSGEAYTKLNKETNIVGGQKDADKLSENNIGVVASQDGDNAKLTVKLSKELKDLTSVETKDKDGNKTEITKDGMTITPKNLETGKTAVKLTKDGLDNGGNKITNVADGIADTDAVNKGQLDKAQAAATTKVDGSDNIQVDKKPEKDGSMTYTVKTKDKMTLGKDVDKQIVVDGETGKLTVGKEVQMDGTTGNARFGTVKVNGKEGTVGGLTNTTWDKDNIVSGRAATEDQLQVLDKKMQNNTEELINKGMDFSGNDYDAENAKTKIHKKLGDRLEIIGSLEAGVEADSKNLRTRVTDDGKLELLMAKNPKFKSVEAGEGDTKVTIGDTGIKIGDKTYITKDGINANGNKITNVADGTADTDAVNKGQLDKAQAAATTKVDGSDNIQVDKKPEKDGSMTYIVKTKDKMTLGKDSDKKIVVDGETGKLTVGKEVEMDGTTGDARFGKVQVNGEKGTVGGLTNKTWDKDNIVSGQAATEDQLKAVDDKVDNLGKKIDDTTEKVEKGLNFAADTGTTNKKLGDTLTIAGDNNNITTSVEEGKVKVALKEDVKVKTLTSETVTTDKLILKGKDGKTTDVGETLDKHDKDIQENKNAIKKGLNFAANHGEVNKQLGDTMSIKGKDGLTEKEIEEEYDVENIVTSVDKDGNLWIKMAKNPKFKSVEAGEGDTKVTIGDIGIKIGDKTYITKDGINANDNKIKNVADGKVAKGSKDAINGGQLHDALSNVQEGMNQINHRVDKLDDRMHRGLANAAAMSTVEFLEIGINQATVGAAIGTYRGNQAVAVGVQAAPTENMRVHAKVSVAPSRNNTETMAGVGASWRFNIK